MIRKSSFGFIIVLVTAFIVVACGRQVTPNPPGLGAGGAPPGFIAIHFDTTSTFNFQNYQYMVVFNTDGTGITPSTDTLQTNWAGYSFALIALGRGGAAYAEPVQFLRNQNPHIPPAWLPLGTTPNTFTFNANSNGGGNEFSLLVAKEGFSGRFARSVPHADSRMFGPSTPSRRRPAAAASSSSSIRSAPAVRSIRSLYRRGSA